MAVDIAGALGIGSGIDTKQLVSDLVAATRDPKEKQITSKATTNNARISALAQAKSSLTTLSSALTELLKSNEYSGQPASNDESIATVSLQSGGVPTGLPAQLEVTQIATAQVLQSAQLAAASSTAGTGTLTFSVGSTSFDVTLSSPKNTLADLAGAINAKAGGIAASVVTDSGGARLVLKGQTGTAQAFTIAKGAGADTNLERFVFNGTGPMTRSQTAQNAKIKIDNVAMEFTSNEVKTAIPYLTINLNKAAPGTAVTLATDQPTSTMADLVKEFVTAYNDFKTKVNANTVLSSADGASVSAGVLASDTGVRDMVARMAKLTTTELTDTGAYRTLSDLGVSTNRDGTLKLDSARLDAAIKADPQAVTQMLNPTVPSATRPGIAGALKTVTDYITGSNGPLAASEASYTKLKDTLTKDLEKLDTSMTSYEDQLSKTYSAMQTRLLALKSTQTYLTQQISIWTKTND